MKRREAKFVHASPRLSPDQIKAAPHLRETRTRSTGRIVPRKAPRAAVSQSIRREKSLAMSSIAMSSIRCPVLGAHVMQVMDLEGNITRIICSEHDASDGTCRLRKSAREGGPLAQLLERISEDTLSTRGTLCVLRAA